MENEKRDIYKNVTLSMLGNIFVDIGIIGSLFFMLFGMEAQFLNAIRDDAGGRAENASGFGHIAAGIFEGLDQDLSFVSLHKGCK